MAKILLVNPNRYKQPPVPPLALEYLAGWVRGTGHEYSLLDLTFSEKPEEDLLNALTGSGPDIAGFTVRNIDSAIYHNNLFFLDDIAALVAIVSGQGIPVVAGGAGFSFAPREVMRYISATWGIEGLGEQALVELLDTIDKQNPPLPGTVLDGWRSAGSLDGQSGYARLSDGVDYGRYLAEGAIGGFRTQAGCRGKCPFCAEADRQVVFRSPKAIILELEKMVSLGVTTFHLCDSEFNQDMSFCHEMLEELVRARIGIHWTLYMKTWPMDGRLFALLAASGADMVTLTCSGGVSGRGEQVKGAVALARGNGIRVAVDYLCGHPGQAETEVAAELDIIRAAAPDTVGVSNCVRLYPGTESARIACENPALRHRILGEPDNNPGLLRPVFYSGIELERVRELIAGDPLFKIEGFERSTNYQRLRD